MDDLQDTLWDGSLIPEGYMSLLAHVWKEAVRHINAMSPADVSSMMYAHYSFQHHLNEIQSEEAAQKVALLPRLANRFDEVSEMATGHDALSALLGLTTSTNKDLDFVQRMFDRHIRDQIPIVNHEILGLIAYALGELQLPATAKLMDGIVRRFQGLKTVEYATMDIDIYANLVHGLGRVQHRYGKPLASRFIQYLDRAGERNWRPPTITKIAWGVARLDAHTPSFVGRILRETLRSGRYFTSGEVRQFQEAIDEMNIEPTDDVWKSLSRRDPVL